MTTIQLETDPNSNNNNDNDGDDDVIIVDNPLDNFKDLKTHKEITDALKAKLIIDDQEVSQHFHSLDNGYVNPKQAVNDYNQYSIHENYFPGGTYSVHSVNDWFNWSSLRLRNEDLLSIQNRSREDDATVNDNGARLERTKNTKDLKSERRHDLNELSKEFMELGAEEEHMFAFTKELLEDAKTKLESFKVELLGRVQLNLKKQNKIIYSQPDPTIGPPTFQSPLKKGGNHKGGALNKGPKTRTCG
jgi:hypothetical protein